MSACDLIQTLYERPMLRVDRGRRKDGTTVVLKRLTDDAAPQARSRFRREYELLNRIDLPGVVSALELKASDGELTMVMEDIGGESLERLLASNGKLPLEQFLELAAGLAETLAGLYRLRVVHKAINPAHIIFNTESGEFRLIGFGDAEELPQSELTLKPAVYTEENLAYISPEQTGRMNRPIDYRTDFYSLGVTSYRILTGKLPFEADDAMGMIHSHIAKAPIPPNELDPNIPQAVSEIVMKLMAKIADDRYQSGWGLKADLEKCLSDLRKEGTVHRFELGREDFSGQLRIPHKLYGRQKEIDQILKLYKRAAAGKCRLLLVAGYPGIGKTALINEARRLIVEQRGNFIQGKFDQLQRTAPYFAWIEAFTGFIDYLLMQSEEQLTEWRERILTSVGGIGRVLTDVIPNLELVIGTQPEVSSLGAHEAQNRFNYVFAEFFKALATNEHPLVVFLDDLQWIDAASLNLLQTIMSGAGISNTLVIGAYRDNEVDTSHPLSETIEALRGQGAEIDLLTLRKLSEPTVNELIAETLHQDRSKTKPLTHLIYSRTDGNPFFLFQTLMALTDKRAIAFDAESRRWKWKMSALSAMEITDNVVELMSQRVDKLPPPTRQILQQAACIGARVNLATLRIASEKPNDVILADLQPALEERLVIPSGPDLEFVHDRIQQAAYSLINEEERKAMHWRIGKLLLSDPSQRTRDERFFDAVNHLTIGAQRFATQQEKEELAEMNLQAGRKAKTRAAFAAAMEYFETGLDLLGEESWETHYRLVLMLHQESAEAACLCGRYDRMKELAEVTHRKALSHLDEVLTYETEIRALTAQGELLPAIRHGLAALERLGMRLPEAPSADEVEEHMARTLALLQERTIEGLNDLPAMTSPLQLACTRIISELGEPAYAASPQFFLVWASLMAELSLRHGNCTLSPFAYAAYALALCATGSHVETGSRLAKAALSMLEQVGARSLRCRLLNIYGCTIQPWTKHLRDTLPTLQEAIDTGAESGDFTSGSYAAFNTCTAAFFMGEPLDRLVQRLQDNLNVIAGMRQSYIWNWVAFHLVAIQRLRGTSDRPSELGAFDEARWLASAKEAKDQCGLAYYFLSRLISDYLIGESAPGEALSHLAEVKANQAGFQAAFAVPVFYFYGSLALLKYNTKHSTSLLDEIRENLSKLEGVARLAPMNFQHKCDLIRAEIARVEGKQWQAAGFYEQAIVNARNNGYLMEEALACELAAIFYLESGMENAGQLHMCKAFDGYSQWQAWKKVRALQAEYPRWLTPIAGSYPERGTNALDLSSVLKVTHTISSEMEMERLLGTVMRTVIENAGAQRGFLLLEMDDKWILAAKGEAGKTEVGLSQPLGIDESNLVSAGVVNFVVRTKERIVLDDAANQGEFTNDPHIRRQKTKSLLCAPLSSRGRLIGVLYLENSLTTHAFTAERVLLLEMLLSQAAISLENARIYEALRESEQKFLAIFNQSVHFIGMLSVDGILLKANQTALQFAGVGEEDVLGKPFWETPWWQHSVEQQQRLQSAIQEAANGKLVRFEATHFTKNGEIRYVDFSLKPVTNDDGRVLQLIPEGRDITDRKQAEEELLRYKDRLEETVKQRTAELLLARDTAEKANKAKSMFLANMSHELRTPLNAILGFSAMLRREPKLTEGQREKLDIINRSGDHLLLLINDVLEIARIEAGRAQLDNTPFDLGAMVRDVTAMMRERAEEKRLQLQIDQTSSFPRYVTGDEARLRQILINLMGNAIKYTQRGGVILRLGSRRNKTTHLLIQVEDTGTGILPEDQQRIFEPFVQLGDQGASTGSGLGLSITHQFVQMMGGSINLESVPGKGTLFRVDLPLREAKETDIYKLKQSQTSDVAGLAPEQPEYRILIVEDQRDNQILLTQLLESVGFQVRIAENGEEGVKLFQSWHPHFIWMDRRMPVMDGMEATRRIRELPGGTEVKIVAVTASAFAEQRDEMLAAGMDDYIRKPFRTTEIYDCISRHLGVKYLYRGVSESPEQDMTLTPEMLKGLPEELRDRLIKALENLDGDRIQAAIQQVAKYDSTLQKKLTHLAGSFNYPAILQALRKD